MKTSNEIMVENDFLKGAFLILRGAELVRIERDRRDYTGTDYYMYFRNADFERLRQEMLGVIETKVPIDDLSWAYFRLKQRAISSSVDRPEKTFKGGEK